MCTWKVERLFFILGKLSSPFHLTSSDHLGVRDGPGGLSLRKHTQSPSLSPELSHSEGRNLFFQQIFKDDSYFRTVWENISWSPTQQSQQHAVPRTPSTCLAGLMGCPIVILLHICFPCWTLSSSFLICFRVASAWHSTLNSGDAQVHPRMTMTAQGTLVWVHQADQRSDAIVKWKVASVGMNNLSVGSCSEYSNQGQEDIFLTDSSPLSSGQLAIRAAPASSLQPLHPEVPFAGLSSRPTTAFDPSNFCNSKFL